MYGYLYEAVFCINRGRIHCSSMIRKYGVNNYGKKIQTQHLELMKYYSNFDFSKVLQNLNFIL